MLRDCEEGCINLFDGYCEEYHIEDISIQGAERIWTNTKQQQQPMWHFILSPKQKYKKTKGQNN